MANDNAVIGYVTPAALAEMMRQTGQITVHETVMSDGKPAIHAALRVVNARTGEMLPGGLPFSVVMFKQANEPGYSNIAIGTIIPSAELDIRLPRDYFNFCNQRLRFVRVFPLDERSFVVQMDLMLRNATREYVKFSLGLWGALFSQVLYELIGRGRESLVQAAEAYAATDVAAQVVSTVAAPLHAEIETLPETAIITPEEIVTPEEASPQEEAETVPLEIVSVETLSPVEAPVEPEAEPAAPVVPEPEGPFSPLEPPPEETGHEVHERLLRMAEPAEGKDIETETDVPGPAETAKPALVAV